MEGKEEIAMTGRDELWCRILKDLFLEKKLHIPDSVVKTLAGKVGVEESDIVPTFDERLDHFESEWSDRLPSDWREHAKAGHRNGECRSWWCRCGRMVNGFQSGILGYAGSRCDSGNGCDGSRRPCNCHVEQRSTILPLEAKE